MYILRSGKNSSTVDDTSHPEEKAARAIVYRTKAFASFLIQDNPRVVHLFPMTKAKASYLPKVINPPYKKTPL